MARAGTDAQADPARQLGVYAQGQGGFAPTLSEQARVFAYLLRARGYGLWHFFFAPNPKSCLAGRAATRLRRMRSVHTLCSAPRDPQAAASMLFADVNVVLSRHTERRLLAAGLSPARLTRIAPAIEPLAEVDASSRLRMRARLGLPTGAPILLYPGDLEFGGGAELMVQTLSVMKGRDAQLVMACRTKTPQAREAERAVKARLSANGLDPRVHFVGETPHIHALLACSDAVVLPSVDLYAKMDYPLVLLEAMSLATPVLVARGSAAQELEEAGGALAADANPDALAGELDRLLCDASRRRALGAAGRQCVLQRYTLGEMARAYQQLYERLLG